MKQNFRVSASTLIYSCCGSGGVGGIVVVAMVLVGMVVTDFVRVAVVIVVGVP